MENLTIRIYLDACEGYTEFTDMKTGTRYACLPIDTPSGYITDKYVDKEGILRTGKHMEMRITAYASEKFGNSHYLKEKLAKEFIEHSSEEELKKRAIIGNVTPWSKN